MNQKQWIQDTLLEKGRKKEKEKKKDRKAHIHPAGYEAGGVSEPTWLGNSETGPLRVQWDASSLSWMLHKEGRKRKTRDIPHEERCRCAQMPARCRPRPSAHGQCDHFEACPLVCDKTVLDSASVLARRSTFSCLISFFILSFDVLALLSSSGPPLHACLAGKQLITSHCMRHCMRRAASSVLLAARTRIPVLDARPPTVLLLPMTACVPTLITALLVLVVHPTATA